MDMRNLQNINGLQRLGEVGVFGLTSNDPRSKERPPAQLAFWRTSTDPALAYPRPNQKLAARAWLLDPAGFPSDLYYSDVAATEMTQLIESFNPQLVVIEGLWLHRYIPILKRMPCRLVLDLHAVESALFKELAESTPGNDFKSKLMRKFLPDRVKVIEHQAANAVDQIWVCSYEDARLMRQEHTSTAPIHVVPNTVNVTNYGPARGGLCRRPESIASTKNTVIFPAIFRWEPNAASAMFLVEEVFPLLVQTFPDCQLLLPGADPTSWMKAAAAQNPHIVVTGTVPDVLPFLAAATAMAVPLRQGGGTRLKILEGFAASVPVVTTIKGAEGLEVENGTHLLFAETAAEFVAALDRIWTEEHVAEELAANGLKLVTRAYSWNASARCIKQAVAALDMKP